MIVIGRDVAEFQRPSNFFITHFCIHFDFDLHFQGDLLQWLDSQPQSDHFDENSLKSRGTSIHAAHFFIDPEYLNHNH